MKTILATTNLDKNLLFLGTNFAKKHLVAALLPNLVFYPALHHPSSQTPFNVTPS
jgi:hypothetical protein